MRIAILSGKGGTGKTFVATNLASIIPRAAYVDCDVEEPNGHIFLQPQQLVDEEVFVPVPVVNEETCTGCRTCVDFCRYNALAFIGGKVQVFADICHNCGGCTLLCPEKAITEEGRGIGFLSYGRHAGGDFYTGRLNPGEASGTPIIEGLLRRVEQGRHETVLIDCPPGSACIVMESIKDADFCVLVAEPTIFGAHNLQMVYELVQLFQKPYGVLLNKNIEAEDNPSARFCEERNIPVLGTIPYSPEIATANAQGLLAVNESSFGQDVFQKIAKSIQHYGGVL